MTDFTKITEWSGKTFDIREALKELGGVWNEDAKVWTLPAITGTKTTVRAGRLSLKPGVNVREVVD